MPSTLAKNIPLKKMKYKRIMLKLSGEALMGEKPYGLDYDMLRRIAREIREIHELGTQICIVVGGGNIFRGVSGANFGMDRATSDDMGMLATVINALALQTMLEQEELTPRVMSALSMPSIVELYVRRRAINYLKQGDIVICAAGSGNPFFTTDTAAALRAAELHCEVIMKATKVDGVYSGDPMQDTNVVRYERLTHQEVVQQGLQVMDTAAIALAEESNIPILVFSIRKEGNVKEVLQGDGNFTVIESFSK